MYQILYVDDEPGFLEISKLFLEETGEFKITTLTSAKKAIDSPEILSFDAIISDYEMPEMDGIAFLKQIRTRSPDIPFILFTGRGREEVVIEAINNGADFYLQKGGSPQSLFAELSHKIHIAVERRRAIKALKDSEERLSIIYNAVEDVIFQLTVGSEGKFYFTSVNAAFSRVTGIPSEQILGKAVNDVIPEPSLSTVLEKYQQAIRNKTTIRWEEVSEYPKGRVTGEVSITPIFDNTGTCTRIIGSMHDITELKRNQEDLLRKQEELQRAYSEITATEEELRQQYDELTKTEREFRLLFDNMNEGMALHEIVFGPDGKPADYRILAANKAYQYHVGLAPSSVIGKTAKEAYNTQEPPYLDLYARVALSGKPETFETYFPPLKRHFRISVYSPGKNQFATVFFDITDSKKGKP